ncbi:MAG: hypothetical protein A2Z69_01630 [Bacteroidetes bacterium RBG_13_44_24]|nr:MAG: hypothetical protein A2Z69_01630 [Bacteroidetes bacterium RBG_13_44_24]
MLSEIFIQKGQNLFGPLYFIFFFDETMSFIRENDILNRNMILFNSSNKLIKRLEPDYFSRYQVLRIQFRIKCFSKFFCVVTKLSRPPPFLLPESPVAYYSLYIYSPVFNYL